MSSNNPYPNPSYPSGSTSAQDWEQGRSAGERASEVADQAKQKASEFGRTAVDKLDKGRQQAASALESTASNLRNRVQSSGDRVSTMANTAADKLQSTASYMRDHDVRGMMGDMGQAVRRNPGASMLVAACFGFLLGSAIRRDRY